MKRFVGLTAHALWLCLAACGGGAIGTAPGSEGDAGSTSGAGGSAGLGGTAGSGGTAAGATGGGSNGYGGSMGTGGAIGGGGSAGGGGTATGGSAGMRDASGAGGSTGMRDASGAGGNAVDAGSIPDAATTAWRPFNDASPWNTLIAANAAADPNSATLITDFATIAGQTSLWINLQQFSVPVYWVDSTRATMSTVRADLGGAGFRTGAANDGAVAGSGPAPIPAGATAAAGSDRHLAIVDRATKMEWGFWDANNGGGNWTAGEASTQDLAGTGVRPPERNSPWWAGHGPRACGFSLIAGLITADEIRAGHIEHALVLAYPHIRSRFYTPPASSAQGMTADAQPNRGILCGGRIQLDPALDVTTLGLSSAGLVIARALQRYGAFVGDFSGAVSIYAEASTEARAYFDGGILNNNTVSRIPLNRFRVLTIGTTYDNMN